MRRIRRLAIVLVAIGLVTSAVYATGAFSSLGTSRDANVNVAGDKAGYLGLAPGENGEYTTYQNGKLQLQLNGALGGEDAPSGGGVNHGAETAITSVFTITNQGAQSVGVWLEDTGDHIEFERASGGSLEGKGNAVQLAPGDTVHVGLTIDTTETDADQLDTQLIINADSDVAGVSPQKGSGPGNDAGKNTDGSAGDAQTESDSSSEANGGDGAADSADDNEKKDTLGQVLDSAKALTLGFFLGDAGMPDGWRSVDSASSPLYLFGQLLNAIAPGKADMIFELRDLFQNAANGKGLETALNAAGLLPVIGQVKGALELRKITTKWMDAFPSKADEMTAFLTDALIKHLPKSAGVKMLSLVSDAPVQKLADEDVPVDDIIKYQDEGVNAQRVIELRSKDVSPEDIRFYVDEGIDLGLVKQLRDEGMKPNRIRFRLGDGSKKSISTLRDQNYNRKEIVELIDMGADLEKVTELSSQGFRKDEIRHFVDKGADLEKVSELKSQKVSHSDINYYVDNDMWLGGVSKLREKGIPPGTTKNIIKIIETADKWDKKPTKKKIEILNREIEGWTIKKSTLEIAKAIVAHNSWEDARENSQSEGENKQEKKRPEVSIRKDI